MKIKKCACSLLAVACFSCQVAAGREEDVLVDRLIHHINVELPTIFEELEEEWPSGSKRLDLAENGYLASDGKRYYACMGFAASVYDQLFKPFEGAFNFADAVRVELECAGPGDVIIYRASEDSDHAVIVTDVGEDWICYVDCNGDLSGGCVVRWDNRMPKAELAEKIKQDLVCGECKGAVFQSPVIWVVGKYRELHRAERA